MASAVSALKEGAERMGRALFREEDGRRRSRLSFLARGGVGRRHQGGGYTGRRRRRLQLLGEEEGEGVFSPLYVFRSGRRKARGHQHGGGLLGPEAEWACCCGGEIKEKE
jgi:hypothetical protein